MFDINYLVIFFVLLIISFLVLYFLNDEKEFDSMRNGMYALGVATMGVIVYFVHSNFIDDTLLTEDFSVE